SRRPGWPGCPRPARAPRTRSGAPRPWWCGAAERLDTIVVAHAERPARQPGQITAHRAAGEFGDRDGHVEQYQVPEPRAGRRIGVVAGHREALSLRREAVPAQLRGNVLPGHAEAVENLGVGHLLAVGDVVALHRERGHGWHEVVRQWRALGHGSSPSLSRSAGTPRAAISRPAGMPRLRYPRPRPSRAANPCHSRPNTRGSLRKSHYGCQQWAGPWAYVWCRGRSRSTAAA